MTGLFVSSVEGHAVTRYGTTRYARGIPSPGLLIGAERDPREPTKITWFPNVIVHIPENEVASYSREYARAIREGALKKRTEAEYAQQQEASK